MRTNMPFFDHPTRGNDVINLVITHVENISILSPAATIISQTIIIIFNLKTHILTKAIKVINST